MTQLASVGNETALSRRSGAAAPSPLAVGWLGSAVELVWRSSALAAARARAAHDVGPGARALYRTQRLCLRANHCLRGLGAWRARSLRAALLLYGAAIRSAARAVSGDGLELARTRALELLPAAVVERALGPRTRPSLAATWIAAPRSELSSWSRTEARARVRKLRRLAHACRHVAAARVEAIGRILLWRFGCCVAVAAMLAGAAAYGYEHWGRPANLLEGRPWRASSALLPCRPLADGGCGPKRADVFFHTREEENPFIEYDLGEVVTLHALEVENASACCRERAVPLVFAVSQDGVRWHELRRRTKSFDSWEARFAPVSARYVRLSVPRRTYLHLGRVAVH